MAKTPQNPIDPAQAIQKITELKKKYNEELKDTLQGEENAIKLQEEQLRLQRDVEKLVKMRHDGLARIVNQTLAVTKQQQLQVGIAQAILDVHEKDRIELIEKLKEQHKDIQAEIERLKLLKMAHEQEMLIAKTVKSSIKDLKDGKWELTKIVDLADKFAESGMDNLSKDTWESLKASVKQMSALDKITMVANKSFNTLNSGVSGLYNYIKQMSIGVESGLQAMNYAMGELQNSSALRDAYIDMSGLIESSSELFESYSTLRNEFVSFSSLSEKQGIQLAKNVTVMAKMGVSAGDTAEMYNTLTTAMGQSIEMTEKFSRELITLAQNIDIGPGKLIQEFNNAIPTLISRGEEAKQIFKDLAVTAKTTGIAISELLQIANKFDTWDDAANFVGRFNALVGGPYLNAIDLMKASENDRIVMLKKTFDQTGKNFEQMSHFERLSIANQLGTSVATATKLFGMNEQQLLKHQKAAEADVKTQEKLNEELKMMQSSWTQVKLSIKKAIIGAMPLLNMFASVLSGISNVVTWMGQNAFIAWGAAALTLVGVVGIMIMKFAALKKEIIGTAVAKAFFENPLKTGLTVAAGVAMVATLGSIFGSNAFADGVTDFSGGTALVGERGPELVTLPRGSNVITNENTNKILRKTSSNGSSGVSKNDLETIMSRVVNEIKNSLNVTIEIDKTKFAKVVNKSINNSNRIGGV
jgi:hypothetical protein